MHGCRAGPFLRNKESRQQTWADIAELQFPLLLCTPTEPPWAGKEAWNCELKPTNTQLGKSMVTTDSQDMKG